MIKRRIAFSISLGLFLLLATPAASAQTETNDFIISIFVEQNAFSLPQRAKVRVKIENRSGQTIPVKDLRSVSINLTKFGRNYKACRRGDCFGASFLLMNRTKLKNGGSFELQINLANLYWRDQVSSNWDLSEPKNMSEVVHAGSYYFSTSLYFAATDSTKEEPRVRRVKSNEILVKVMNR